MLGAWIGAPKTIIFYKLFNMFDCLYIQLAHFMKAEKQCTRLCEREHNR